MIFRTHLIFGIFLSLIYLNLFGEEYFFVLGLLVGSVFLDIDSYSSKLGRRFLSRVLTAFFKHRGVVHSLFFVLSLSLLFGLFDPSLGFGFFVGGFGHLVLDSITKQGVRIFYPFRVKIKGPFKSGKKFDSFLFVLFSLFSVYLFGLVFLEIYSLLL